MANSMFRALWKQILSPGYFAWKTLFFWGFFAHSAKITILGRKWHIWTHIQGRRNWKKKSIENITQLKSSYVLKNKPVFVSILNLPFFKWNCSIYETLAWEAVFCRIGGIWKEGREGFLGSCLSVKGSSDVPEGWRIARRPLDFELHWKCSLRDALSVLLKALAVAVQSPWNLFWALNLPWISDQLC